MSDLGTDLDCTDDLNALGTTVTGERCVAQNLYRRFSTPRGTVIDAPDYGKDLRAYLHKAMTPTQIAAIPGEVRAEALKEERLDTATVRVDSATNDAITISLTCATAEGPFTLTLNVTAAAVVLTEVR